MLRNVFIKIISISFIFQIIVLSTISAVASFNGRTTNAVVSFDVEKINVTFKSSNYALYGEIYYSSNGTGPFPGIVFCEGLAGYVNMYNWVPEALAKQGYVVLIFDFPGQGKSEGIFGNRSISIPILNLYLRFGAFIGTRFYYVDNDFVKATMDAITYLTDESPVKNLVDNKTLGLIGHSLGGLIVTETAAVDKRIDAVVALSQGNITDAEEIDVPIQFQAGCFDFSTYSIPITYLSYKRANTPKELITIQFGTHIGFTTAFAKFCLCPPWQKEISLRYAIGWFDYFLKNKTGAYEKITTGADHLSKIIRSRYNFGDGEHILKTSDI
ncbi:MAG: alpha/beta fold hydrolase [Euryarchaeota archaeon]|nr:alpha/beta fold hydrolase [Euryarchaeota archaeon]